MDILGSYSLNEVAVKLNTSPSWINKVQQRTGICKKNTRSGRKASFSEDELLMLQNANVLRTLVFEIKHIKEVYEIEKKMIDIAGTYGKTQHSHKESRSFIIHPYTFDYPVYTKADGSDFKSKKEAKTYEELAKNILKVSKEVSCRAIALSIKLENIGKRMKKNAGK